MNALRLMAVGMMVGVVASGAPAHEPKDKPDNAKLLVGKWEVTNANKELPPGSVIEFGKDGKMKITRKADGKEETADAVYKVEGDKIQFTLKLGNREEKKDPVTIKKIAEQELTLESGKELTLQLKRMK
jgi:uncharacterized protein (TIGR03066 family)